MKRECKHRQQHGQCLDNQRHARYAMGYFYTYACETCWHGMDVHGKDQYDVHGNNVDSDDDYDYGDVG